MMNEEENNQTEFSKEVENNNISKNTEKETEIKNNEPEKAPEKKSNKALTVIRRTGEIIIWILIVIVLIMFLMVSFSQKKSVFGYRLYLVLSGSMEPTIHVKQAVLTKQIDEPQVGDAIAFEKNGYTTIHRITKVYTEGEKRLYQTKGDNNNDYDKELVKKEMVTGKVVCVLPGVGETVYYLQHHIYILVIAICVLLIYIVVKKVIL